VQQHLQEALRMLHGMQEQCSEAEAKVNGLADDNGQLRAQLAKKAKKRNKRMISAACQCTPLDAVSGNIQAHPVQRHADHKIWRHSVDKQVCF
jgi:DNA repair exonuclease SbcCD ATPase subunit